MYSVVIDLSTLVLYYFFLLDVEESLWSTNKTDVLCQENLVIEDISSRILCQKECENNDKCNGICYPRYNVLDETDCYLCFGDEFIDVPEHLVEAGMEFKKRN